MHRKGVSRVLVGSSDPIRTVLIRLWLGLLLGQPKKGTTYQLLVGLDRPTTLEGLGRASALKLRGSEL